MSLENLIDVYNFNTSCFKRNSERYGLIWKDHPEKLDNPDIIPLLKEKEGLSVYAAKDKPLNYLIEGDNYHALQALQRTHKGKIDVIYIDPPYNTGKQFVYNDNIYSESEEFAHSKWLSFMSRRLCLAKELLADDGIIFVSIDDYTQAQLKLLLDKIFKSKNFLSQFVWIYSRNNIKDGELLTTGTNLGKIKKSKEYILAYAKEWKEVKLNQKPLTQGKFIKSRITKNKNKRNEIVLKKGMRSELKEGSFKGVIGGDSEPITIKGEMKIKDYRLVEDVVIEGSFSNPKIVQELMAGHQPFDRRGQRFLEVYLTKTGVPYTLKEKKGDLYSDVISGYGSSAVGNREIVDIFHDSVFNYPKPIDVIKHILRLSTDKNAVVLDFFAGSGTTGHAVMELNEEDGGNRQFILCTNNEVSEEKERKYLAAEGYIERPHKRLYNKFKKEHPEQYEVFLRSEEYQELGIARAVTRERLKRVIEGYTTPKGKEVEGLPNNLVYLRTIEGHKSFFEK